MAVLETLTRDQYIIFLDIKQDLTFESCDWAAIDLSTIFELNMNEQTEEFDFICYKNAVTEVESNKPEMAQEIRTVQGNKMHDFIAKHFKGRPVGEQCKVPFLLCFGGSDKAAWRGICTITSKSLNTVDKKYAFTLAMGGDIQDGTYSIDMGKPTFSPTGLPASLDI